jgi:hypothetical protein
MDVSLLRGVSPEKCSLRGEMTFRGIRLPPEGRIQKVTTPDMKTWSRPTKRCTIYQCLDAGPLHDNQISRYFYSVPSCLAVSGRKQDEKRARMHPSRKKIVSPEKTPEKEKGQLILNIQR